MAEITTQISDFGTNLINSVFIWFAIIIGLILAGYLFLRFRRTRAMMFTAIEHIEIGDNRTGKNILKCGWIGKEIYLRGLFWRGRKVMRTDKMEEILNYSEEDFSIINGKKAVELYRHPISRQLVPITKTRIEGKECVGDIPPAEYVDAAVDIIKETHSETKDFKTQLLAWAGIGLVAIICLISIMLITNMVNAGQDKAAKLLIDSSGVCMENARVICSEICGKVGVTAP